MRRISLLLASVLAVAGCNKASTPVRPSAGALSPQTVVATYGDKQVTLGEVDASVSKDLYELRRGALESLILKDLVQQEAKKAGKSEEELLRGVATEGAAKHTNEEELRKLYEQNKQLFGDRTFEQVRPMLEQRTGGEAALMAYFEELKKKNNVQILLGEPRVEVAAEGPSKGPKDAPVTIVEFSDFECPYCAKASETVEQVVAAYAGKVRLVFRDFPLPFHEKAQKASEAGLCAEEQGKFWEMHDHMFDNQGKLSVDELKAAAKTLGLDAARFDSCLDSGKFASRVQANIEAGKEAGVSGTPAFFINGRMISGAQPIEKFKEIIDSELSSQAKK